MDHIFWDYAGISWGHIKDLLLWYCGWWCKTACWGGWLIKPAENQFFIHVGWSFHYWVLSMPTSSKKKGLSSIHHINKETNSLEIIMNMRWMLFLWVGDKGSTRQGYCYLWSWCGIQEDWFHHQVYKPTKQPKVMLLLYFWICCPVFTVSWLTFLKQLFSHEHHCHIYVGFLQWNCRQV